MSLLNYLIETNLIFTIIGWSVVFAVYMSLELRVPAIFSVILSPVLVIAIGLAIALTVHSIVAVLPVLAVPFALLFLLVYIPLFGT